MGPWDPDTEKCHSNKGRVELQVDQSWLVTQLCLMSWHKQWYSLLSSGGGMVPIDANRKRQHSQHRWEGKLEVKSPGRRLRNADRWQSSRDSDAGTCYHKCLKSPHSGWSDVLESNGSANLATNTQLWQGFPGGSVVKNPCASTRDAHSIPGSGRSPGGGNGNPLQYSCRRIPWTEEPGSYSPWGCKESDTTERLTLSHFANTSMTLTMCQLQFCLFYMSGLPSYLYWFCLWVSDNKQQGFE